MISGFGLWGLAKGILGTFWGRAIIVGLAALMALKVNNIVQRSVGEKRGIAKVVKESNQVARKRNEKARSIRSRIKPDTAWQQLLTEYPRDD
jgi:hypothetical protein